MTWSKTFREWLRLWLTPRIRRAKPVKTIAALELEYARAKKQRKRRSHLIAAMKRLRTDGLRTEMKRKRA